MKTFGFSASIVLVLMAQLAWGKATVCHIPPGDPDHAHTLSVGDGAVQAHLGHGDCVGACPCDRCPDDPAKTEPGICGCGFTETLANTNGVGCTFCTVSGAPEETGCQLSCLGPPSCLCGGA